MDLLITGASGYVGAAVARAARTAGHRVYGLARADAAARQLHDAGLQVRRGDLRDADSLRAAVRGVDAVVHTAFGGDAPDGAELDRSATEVMLDSLADGAATRPAAFVYTSGIGVYGDTGARQHDETDTPLPLPMMAWRPPVEQLALGYAERGVRAMVLRPPLVHGHGGSGFLLVLIDRARAAGAASYIGDGTHGGPSVHVDDLAELYVAAVERGRPGGIYHAAGPFVTMRELATGLAAAAGTPGSTVSLSRAEAERDMGPFAAVLAANLDVTGRRTAAELDWHPRRTGLLDDLIHGSYPRTDPMAAR